MRPAALEQRRAPPVPVAPRPARLRAVSWTSTPCSTSAPTAPGRAWTVRAALGVGEHDPEAAAPRARARAPRSIAAAARRASRRSRSRRCRPSVGERQLVVVERRRRPRGRPRRPAAPRAAARAPRRCSVSSAARPASSRRARRRGDRRAGAAWRPASRDAGVRGDLGDRDAAGQRRRARRRCPGSTCVCRSITRLILAHAPGAERVVTASPAAHRAPARPPPRSSPPRSSRAIWVAWAVRDGGYFATRLVPAGAARRRPAAHAGGRAAARALRARPRPRSRSRCWRPGRRGTRSRCCGRTRPAPGARRPTSCSTWW